MVRRFCSALIIAVCVLSAARAEEPKPAAPDLAAADKLFRSGKFADAETAYLEVLRTDPRIVAAHVGMVRSMLRQQKIDEALEAVNSALAREPNSAALLATRGEVQFRRGEMAAAEISFLAAKKLDNKEARTYLGLWKLYRAYSLYRHAYDQLQFAHEIAPNDLEVQRAWMGTLSRKERLAALRAYLAGPHPDDVDQSIGLMDYLTILEATADKPLHRCKLVNKVEKTSTKLEEMYSGYSRGAPVLRGLGLQVGLNGKNARLLLDTGAGGVVIGRKIAERAGLTRLAAEHYGGIGDKGWQTGYIAQVDRIRIGELEFQDCVVSVTDKNSVAGEDGLIGADVFSDYLVDLDFPDMKLNLTPLPKRPEDTTAPASLNSEGEDDADAEIEEATPAAIGERDANDAKPASKPRRLPKDRYVAPEMANWTRVFRFGHSLLVPTTINDSKQMLFDLDTGAFNNLLSLRVAKQIGKVSSDAFVGVRGVSGAVNKVYTVEKATIGFGRFKQPNLDLIAFDLSNISKHTGTEVSGFLGFGMLRVLDIKLDYRDGLVDFSYDSRRVRNLR